MASSGKHMIPYINFEEVEFVKDYAGSFSPDNDKKMMIRVKYIDHCWQLIFEIYQHGVLLNSFKSAIAAVDFYNSL